MSVQASISRLNVLDQEEPALSKRQLVDVGLEPQDASDRAVVPARTEAKPRSKLRRPAQGMGAVMSYRHLTVWSTWICFAAAPLAGSLVSFLVCGGAGLALIEAIRGRFPLVLGPDARRAAYGVCIFIAAYALSGLANGELFDAPNKYAWLLILLSIPLSMSLLAEADKARLVQAVTWGSAVGCAGALVIALIQRHLLGAIWAEGGAGNSSVFGTVSALVTVMALAGAMRHRGWHRTLLVLCFGAGLVAVLYSGQRGVWPALLAAPVLICIAFRSEFGTGIARFVSQAALLSSTLVAFGLFEWFTSRFTLFWQDWWLAMESSAYDTSVGQRLAIWRIGYALIEEKPILGFGIVGAKRQLEEKLMTGYGIDAEYTHFHSLLVTAGAEAGLIGIFALLFLLIGPIATACRFLWQADRETERFGAMLVLLASLTLVTSGLTNKLFGHDLLTAMLALCFGIGLYVASGTQRPSNRG